MARIRTARKQRESRFPGAETWEKTPRWLRLTIMWAGGLASLAVLFLLLAVAFAARSLPSYEELKAAQTAQTIVVRAADGSEIVELGPSYGEWLDKEEIPAVMKQAMIAVEDRRFYSHFGVDIWRTGAKGLGTVFLGGLLAGIVVAWPALVLPKVNANPEINDITTDWESPPQFPVLAARRQPGANLPEYPGEVFAEQQRAAFPDLKSLLVNRSVSEAYEVSVDALRRVGMKIVQENPPGDEAPAQGSIEAYDRTLVWGFYDDVVIRVIGNRLTAKIDVRSASRYGRHDLGRNAERVRRLLKEIVARLEATVSGPQTSNLRGNKRKKTTSR